MNITTLKATLKKLEAKRVKEKDWKKIGAFEQLSTAQFQPKE